MKAFSAFLFFASMLLAGALVFGLSGCSSQEKKEPPAAARHPPKTEVTQPQPPPIRKDGPVSVDFDKVPLTEVAQFVTGITGKGFILNGSEALPISWIEYNIARQKLFDSFANTLTAAGLVLKSTTDDKTVFTINKAEEIKVPYKLDFATCARGTFFLLGSTVFLKEQFPYPVKHESGSWFAIIPKSIADSLQTSEGKQNAKI
jgi:hypothetical protein